MPWYVDKHGNIYTFTCKGRDTIELDNGETINPDDRKHKPNGMFATEESSNKFSELVKQDPSTANENHKRWYLSKVSK